MAAVIRWARAGACFAGHGQPHRIRWLRARLGELAQLIDWRTAQYSTGYPLGELLGMPLPPELPSEPVLGTLLRAALLDRDDPAEIQLWWEPDFLAELRAGVTSTLATLDESTGMISLPADPAAVRGWSSVLLHLRIAYTATWAPELLTTGELPDAPADRQLTYQHAAWLWDAVNTLHAFAVN